MGDEKKGIQGEGNPKDAKKYRESTKEFIDSGKVDEAARKAQQARSGAEREELERAEEKGKKRAKGADR